ncbi:MAG TPA: type II toxin-antitoxin system VapB family antitoxin [Caulobacteraceae bacterium]|jgi:antitoxin VapB|nr:type II toxin-antitoxin system VapB family antitoxin [Caulobacteraceae bacterium]
MGIFIKNPEVERKARELAQLTGTSLTVAVGRALEKALAEQRRAEAERAARMRPRPTLEQMIAATDEFRRKVGLDKVKLNATKADFDAMWEIPGLDVDFDPK